MTMKKLTKAEVNYGKPPANSPRRCFVCKHFITGGSCEIVEGDIRPSYLCDRFERQR